MRLGRESFSLSASVSWLIVTMALMVDGRLWNYGELQGILGWQQPRRGTGRPLICSLIDFDTRG